MAAESVAIPESTDPSLPPDPSARRPVPWRGRRRTEAGEAKDEWIGLRVTAADLARIKEKAQTSGLKIGGYLRALALGTAGPRAVRRPVVEREQLARLLGEIGKLGSNVNQIAHRVNATDERLSAPEFDEIKSDIATMREAVMRALDHGD